MLKRITNPGSLQRITVNEAQIVSQHIIDTLLSVMLVKVNSWSSIKLFVILFGDTYYRIADRPCIDLARACMYSSTFMLAAASINPTKGGDGFVGLLVNSG